MDNKNNLRTVYKSIMLIIIVAIVSSMITASYVINKIGTVKQYSITGVDSKLITKISMVKSIINRKYLEKETNEQNLIDGAIKGYVSGLGDDYTQYFTAAEMEEFKTETEGNYVGIGIYMALNKEKNEVVVLMPLKGSSAEEVGIKTGDIIRKVDGVTYTGDDFEKIASVIKGKEGTKVELEIERNNENLKFEVERKNIELFPIESQILDGNIGYIDITMFTEGCARKFKEKYNELNKKNLKGLIIDLRDNGGGILDEALDIADYILEKDSIILIEKDRDGETKTEKSKKSPIITVPVVILTNGNSASASEVLTAALKENNKAIVVGEQTFGKGVIQELITLQDGSGIKITVEEYFTPKENKINNIGITPDEEVTLPEGVTTYNLKQENDTQLKKALEIIKK